MKQVVIFCCTLYVFAEHDTKFIGRVNIYIGKDAGHTRLQLTYEATYAEYEARAVGRSSRVKVIIHL